ncbi:fluoride efflux transporter FluC [Arthrobacter sp. VKM Ac-2550]|uniref:fluoride efflux transporter FluC n=1 Tax=Crystallibacter permensis TaxID=1938888 RepID=UPI00224184C0|nr:CrcB family protein [Arthrobacter sp. VKM Ac-2550]MCW2132690.1 camphor resistance protein CrcB [Arthrobacter sp. VKM Ac-2550]
MTALAALLVGVFGMAGALARFAADTLFSRAAASGTARTAWPWSTLLVNVVGSFIIGLVCSVTAQSSLAEPWSTSVATGLAGGLTTFSSWTVSTVRLWAERRPVAAVVNLAANLSLGLGAAALGLLLFR